MNLKPATGGRWPRAAGREPIRLEEAFRKAPDLINDATTEDAFDGVSGGYTPSQQQAAKGGLVNWAYTQVRRGADLAKSFRSPAAQAKLGKILGADKAGAFTEALAKEKAMLPAERSIPPGAGSPTMPLQQAQREADGDRPSWVSSVLTPCTLSSRIR